MKKLTNKSQLLILLVILIGAFVVRLYKIDSPIADWHSWRQTATASVTRIYIDNGIDLFYPKQYDISSAQTGYENPEGYFFVELPIYGAIHTFVFGAIGGIREIWGDWFIISGRLVSILASLFSVLFIFLLGKRYIDFPGGLIAAFFFAFLPFNVFYSRVILPEPLAVAFGLSALYMFGNFVDFNQMKWLIVSAILFSIAILVKPFVIFYFVPVLYLALGRHGSLGVLRSLEKIMKDWRMWMFALVALIPFLFWRGWISQFPEGIPHTKWAFNGDGIRFRPAFWRWIFGERLGKMLLGVWGLIIFAFGIVSKKTTGFVLSFLLGAFLFAAIFATANVRHDYYQIIVLPPIVLTLAAGAICMWNPPNSIRKVYSRVLLIFSIIMMFGGSWYQIREFYKVNRSELVEVGERVVELTPKESLVIAPYNKDMTFLYHTGRFGWPFVNTDVGDLIGKGADYFVSVNFNDPDTISVMDEYEVVEKSEQYVIVDLNRPISKTVD